MTEQMKQALDNTVIEYYPNWQDTNNSNVDAMEQMMVRIQRRSFKNGIDWYINNLWHDADNEQPIINSSVVVMSKDKKELEVKHKVFGVLKGYYWCYLKDILPTIIEE